MMLRSQLLVQASVTKQTRLSKKGMTLFVTLDLSQLTRTDLADHDPSDLKSG